MDENTLFDVMTSPGGEIIHNALMENGRLKAELAALRAELAALQAAQQWQPVTEKPADDGRYLIGWDYDEEAGAEVGDYMAAADMWFYQGAPATPTHWRPRPIPPLPNEVQP